jgi:DNA-binding CsgD family transcriptional regulator
MERADAIHELPSVYADVLRWRADGASDATIGERLDIPPSSVRLLLRVAEAKLDSLVAHESRRAVS